MSSLHPNFHVPFPECGTPRLNEKEGSLLYYKLTLRREGQSFNIIKDKIYVYTYTYIHMYVHIYTYVCLLAGYPSQCFVRCNIFQCGAVGSRMKFL